MRSEEEALIRRKCQHSWASTRSGPSAFGVFYRLEIKQAVSKGNEGASLCLWIASSLCTSSSLEWSFLPLLPLTFATETDTPFVLSCLEPPGNITGYSNLQCRQKTNKNMGKYAVLIIAAARRYDRLGQILYCCTYSRFSTVKSKIWLNISDWDIFFINNLEAAHSRGGVFVCSQTLFQNFSKFWNAHNIVTGNPIKCVDLPGSII